MTLTTSLVQSLTRPPKSDFHAKLSQAFGGGMMAMSKDQWACLQQVFDIHYMGAAEYEFGAFPQAIYRLIEDRKGYDAWSFVIPKEKIKPNYWRSNIVDRLRQAQIAQAKREGKKPPRLNREKLAQAAKVTVLGDKTVWVFGPKDRHPEVEEMILEVARSEMWIKNGSSMERALDPDPGTDYDSRFCGWFDLNNRIFWFTDEKMWSETVELFSHTEPAKTEETHDTQR